MDYPTSGAIVLEVLRNKSSGERKVKIYQYGIVNDAIKFEELAFCNGNPECSLKEFYEYAMLKAIPSMEVLAKKCARQDPEKFQKDFQLATKPV